MSKYEFNKRGLKPRLFLRRIIAIDIWLKQRTVTPCS